LFFHQVRFRLDLYDRTGIADRISLRLTLKIVPLQFVKFVPRNGAALISGRALTLSINRTGQQE
jgi:hypothetical protein